MKVCSPSNIKKVIWGGLFIVTLLLSLTQINSTSHAAGSTTYYVSTTGSDSNSGTSTAKPWRTIQKAANTMVAGDTVIVLAGNYSERVTVSRSGSANAPITFQSDGGVSMNGFVLNNASYITIRGFYITDTPNSWTGYGIYVVGSNNLIEDNHIYYATRGGISIFASIGAENGTTNNIVRNNRLERNAMDGIEVYGRNNLIEGNEIWATIQSHPKWTPAPSYADADGIRFFGSGHIIRSNYIHDISFDQEENVDPHIDCFQTWEDSNHETASNILFEQNFCVNLQAQATNEVGQGFMINYASNLIIRNNIIKAHRQFNILNGTNFTITNNTLVGRLDLTSYYPSGLGLQNVQGVTYLNNLNYNLASYNIICHDTASCQSLTASNNLTYRSDGKTPAGSAYANELWKVNPMLVNPGADDYHLQPSSPAIDKGMTVEDIIDDYDGNSRPMNAAFDIGAFEYQQNDMPDQEPIEDPIEDPIIVPIPGPPDIGEYSFNVFMPLIEIPAE